LRGRLAIVVGNSEGLLVARVNLAARAVLVARAILVARAKGVVRNEWMGDWDERGRHRTATIALHSSALQRRRSVRIATTATPSTPSTTANTTAATATSTNPTTANIAATAPTTPTVVGDAVAVAISRTPPSVVCDVINVLTEFMVRLSA
jgi:hypothetical protein